MKASSQEDVTVGLRRLEKGCPKLIERTSLAMGYLIHCNNFVISKTLIGQ